MRDALHRKRFHEKRSEGIRAEDRSLRFESREGEDKTEEKRAAMKELTNLLNEDTAIKEIKEKVNMELIEEEARWKIYAKALE
jgi:hypothetical protein